MLRILQSGVGIGCLILGACSPQHSLRHDAEATEDLAIRYADAHSGPHSGHFDSMIEYARVRDRRLAEMFKTVAARDGVTEEQVRESLSNRLAGVDLFVMLSFALFYVCAAGLIARWVPHQNWIAMSAYISVVVSAAEVLLGEQWAVFVESVRLGTGHLSYRGGRIPWTHHRLALYFAGIAIYLLVAAFRERRTETDARRAMLA